MSYLTHAFQVELIPTTPCLVGENPIWHAGEGCLYWCDIPNGILCRYDLAQLREERFEIGRPLGAITIQDDDSLLLFLNGGTVVTWQHGQVKRTVVHEISSEQSSRFNDAIVDPHGRVLCGTMSTAERKGRLYRLDLDGTTHVLLESVGCSNGMAFSADAKHLFHTDSTVREIHRYSYDVAHGTLGDKTLFARLDADEGLPDGATMDAEGHLWSARWDGGCVVRYAKDGTSDRKIDLPVRKASSLTFAGPSLDDIYITTASLNEADPDAGRLYRVRAGVRGVPEFRSRIGLTKS